MEEKTYKTKAGATRALSAAIKSGAAAEADNYEVQETEGGFKIVKGEPLTPKALMQMKSLQVPEHQKAVLKTLSAVESLAEYTDGEKADVFFPFKEIEKSELPLEIPSKRSMGGIMKGLISRGLVRAMNMDVNGRQRLAVCITPDGLAAIQA